METGTGAAWRGLRREKKRGREERKSSPAVPYQPGETLREFSRREEETRVHPQLPFSHKQICPLASTLTCPSVSSSIISILCSFILPSSSFSFPPKSLPFQPFLPPLFFPPFYALLLCICPCLPSSSNPWNELVMTVVWVHSGEGEL